MTEATAYRLKQIMTQEHLSLTQAAKQIGISPSSMRKALKETTMSRPITFKINRFIEEHPIQQQKNSFTIFDSAEAESAQQAKAPAKRQPAKSKAQAKPEQTEKPAPKQARQPRAAKSTAKPAKQGRQQQNAASADQSKEAESATAKQTNKQPRRQPRSQAQAKPAANRPTHRQAQSQAATAATSTKPVRPATETQDNQKPNRRRQRNSQQAAKQTAPVQAQTKPATEQPATKPAAAEKAENKAQRENNEQQHERQRRGRRPAKLARNTTEPVASQSATTTPTPEPTSQTAVQTIDHTDIHPVRQETTIMIYMDESFGGGSDYQRNMSIGATVVDPDDTQALVPFMQTLYPFGWQPGDEVKARGKARDQLEAMLRHAKNAGAQTYAVYSPLSDTGNFSLSFGILYPYVAALLRILDALPSKPTKVRVVMDQRSEITDEQLAMAARMLHAYVKAQTGREVIFMFRTTDSKTTIGVQYSDFVSHAAMIFGPDQVASTGIHKLPNIGGQLGDQLQLFAMVGLQKYLLDDRPSQNTQSEPFNNPVLNAADRMAHLAAKAADMAEVPDETFAQTKLVINQLLQIAPASVSGAINKMPFQNWYDMIARTAAILHYTDETLPPFKIDPDAMQIVTDALNNIATLLAGVR
ncbi:DUF3800 domain-containing protein [Lacticaseibacillus suibinensis]|uniref:DUF3800 domain-containing protein n=1 Tax=Lacticaseibacillus suibinensis TaxID=2486011 RepID=UPI000F79ACE8|nr:DUF3800 domain-containing protein [Lacticaseibacillus suibinensis]